MPALPRFAQYQSAAEQQRASWPANLKAPIMNQQATIKIDRMAGAEAISARARAVGTEHGVVICDCVWDIGQSFELQHAHRLDLSTPTKTVRLYFPDLELVTSGNDARTRRTEERLRRAIAQLLPRSPSPTYATSVY
jgi:hypothetical protein